MVVRISDKTQNYSKVTKLLVKQNRKSLVSKIISNSIEAGYIKLSDENAAVKMRRYIPYWA